MSKHVPAPGSIHRMLIELRAKRDADAYTKAYPQCLSPSEPYLKGIPTLKKSVYRRPTSMLRERFDFCGRWSNPFIGLEFLGISDMINVVKDNALVRQIDARRRYWKGSAPSQRKDEDLSLFAVDRNDMSEVYLVWKNDFPAEPGLAWYVAQHEHYFRNLSEMLKYLLGNSKPRRRSRLQPKPTE